jgi:hypothetical protein
METLDPHGGGGLHASALRPPFPASSSEGEPDTPTPNRWLSGELGPSIDLEITPPEPRLVRTPDRATEARNGIKRKASQVLGRPTLNAGILDTSKALAGLLAQVQNAYQDRLEQIQAQLTEELQNWKTEQQTREYKCTERITTLEHEVTSLRKELEEAKEEIQKHEATRQSTPGTPAGPTQESHRTINLGHSQSQSQLPKPAAKTGQNQPQKQSTFANLAALLATRPGGQGWQEVPPKRKQQKRTETAKHSEPSSLKPARDSPKEARRILFRREDGQTAPRAEREDIILAVNRGLANGGFPGFIRAIDAGYSSSGAVTVLLEKGALGSMLLPDHRDLLVTAVRQADPAIISAELPEQWYRVKIHGVPTRRYLSCGLALAREEIELGTEVRLKRNPTWLRRPKELQNGKKGSTIVITVGSLEEARKLLINGIRFGGSRYRTEHYWEVGVDTVCPRCGHLGHRSFKACGSNPPCCFICAGAHEGHEHTCRVVNCPAKPGTACQHTPAKCSNCGGPHPATAGNCPAKRAARKQRKENKQAPRSNDEPATLSPAWFTVINRNQSGTRTRSSSALTNPQTPKPNPPRETVLDETMDISDDQVPEMAIETPHHC